MWRSMALAGLTFMTAVSCLEPAVLYSWRQLDYNFPNESMRQEYVASEDFVQKNNLPVGITAWNGKLFVAVSRWKKGVPANLNYISTSAGSESPKLTPYPSFEANDVHSDSDDVIVSMYRSRVDACDRLWGVDSGLEDVLGEPKTVRPLRLVVVDLKTDKIIRTYTFKKSDQTDDSIFTDIVIDTDENSCDKAHAYAADPNGQGLVVYSWEKNDSWRFKHHYFCFDPIYGDYNISGINFQWADGVFGMALSRPHRDGSRTLYFQPNAGIRVFSVPTGVLKNESLARADNYHKFKLEGEKGPMTQGTSMAIDPDTQIIYFTLLNKHGIACWDTKTPLTPESFKIIAQDEDKLAFPNDITIDLGARKLYVLMNNLPKLMFNKMGPDSECYVHSMPLDELTEYCRGRFQQARVVYPSDDDWNFWRIPAAGSMRYLA